MRIPLKALTFLILLPPLWIAPSWADRDFPPHVKTIVEQRCMVCHGCYDAPCQLKMDAWAGLERGASKDEVYDGSRLITANTSRLFEDALNTEEWREKGFYPVLNPEEPSKGSAVRMLELKQKHPLPTGGPLPDSFDLSLDRDQQCAKEAQFDRFAQDHPQWGMPYALPALNPKENETLTNWLLAGAPSVPTTAPSAIELAAVKQWETFLNGNSLKEQLMARYIYEHLFVGTLYFSDLGGDSGNYTIVRSRTPAGEEIDLISTRRPYDDPGTTTFYYRLQTLRTAVLDKRHMPYALSEKRLQRWHTLFLQPQYEITALPSYKTSEASNPFVSFRELPQDARYRFMLEEAQFTIMGFIKGPVCRGAVALNVIDDHFWVVFIDPDRENAVASAEFLSEEAKDLRLPAGKSGLLISIVDWVSYSRQQMRFLKAKSKYIKENTKTEDTKLNLDLIWKGYGENDNASLTVFRHFDSSTVVKGMVGQEPKTAWVIDYSLLERIHYLLVAGFDVYGNVGHQLETRLYMDFLRMEGEQNFLYFMPSDERLELRDYWYRDASDRVKKFVLTDAAAFDRDTDVVYTSTDEKSELLERLKQQLPGATAERFAVTDPEFSSLINTRGKGLHLMPEVAFLEVLSADGEDRIYSIVHNSGFKNNAHLFGEEGRRLPEEDYVSVVKGFIGSYPNIFFQVPEADLSGFVKKIETMETEEDYAQLVSYYGVRRNAPWFWRLSDKLQQHYQDTFPIEAGLFDLNRYENR
ncbi:MAG: hypothetical protein ACI9JM_001056 [Halioglobus sp.]|jgi:hypothetical protein